MGGRLIVVGYGNMGKALVAGVIKAGLVAPGAVVAVDPAASEGGCARVGRIDDVGGLRDGDAVVLAVKPQVFPAIAQDLSRAVAVLPASGVLVVSIMAGVTSRRIADALGARARVVRAMPNTPAQIGQGATAFALGPSASEGDARTASAVLGALGPLVIRIDETLMDAFTAVAGSGPAYLFYLAESMTAGAIAAGFDAATADAVVRQTLAGAAGLLAVDGATPAELRARVTSKGGTTEAALNVLMRERTSEAMVAAIVAARDRGRELGKA